MTDKKLVSVELQFRSVDYSISLYLSENEDKLFVELNDVNTADSWKGQFEMNCKFNRKKIRF